ncbi:hypothetical protein NLG97_g9252 [Lecanicillium saksenae]|uniref:Uncharacterized protein n=1 Tax=Lecanicillium saksenae TaxID=468837 RepID=A0ACC1QH27_9HYPO|nr:hypothetical protein NLG97_g9252 [Lecanicillium saksenae]
MASVSHALHGSPGRMQMLLAQIQAEFSGQQQQRNDDYQRQLGELHSMRQMLDTLEKRYKSETEELRTKIRSQEDAIHHLQAQLAAREHGSSSDTLQNLAVARPTSEKLPETTQDWTELPLESIASQHKQTGSDWYALFNPHVPRRLNIGLLHTLEHNNIVCCVRFSAEARCMATASHQTAKIFDIGTGELVATLDEHHSSTVGESIIRSISFSPDGLSLATSAEDGVIRVSHVLRRPTLINCLSFDSPT